MRQSLVLLLRCALFILCPQGEELLVLTVSPLCSWHPCFQSAAKIKCVARFSPFSKEKNCCAADPVSLRCSWLSLTLRRGTRMSFRSSWTPPSEPSPSLSLLGLITGLCNWILDFLRNRFQSGKIHNIVSSNIILNTRSSHGCVLSHPHVYKTGLWLHSSLSKQLDTEICRWHWGGWTGGVVHGQQPRSYNRENQSDDAARTWSVWNDKDHKTCPGEKSHISPVIKLQLWPIQTVKVKRRNKVIPPLLQATEAPQKIKGMHNKRLPWTSSASGANVEIFKLLLHDIVA